MSAAAGNLPAQVQAAMDSAVAFGGRETLALDVGDVLGITDYFVVTSAGNVRQVRRIAEEVERYVKQAGGDGPIGTEGLDSAQWVLLDFGAFVVHVFHDDARDLYKLERLWSDVPRIDAEVPAPPHGAAIASQQAEPDGACV